MQVYTWNHTYAGLNGVNNWKTAGTELDTTTPYGEVRNLPVSGDDETGDGPIVPTDSVGKVNYSPVTINDSPTMWLMYTPKAKGSIDVPICSCNWPWGGTAKWNAKTGWGLTNQFPAFAHSAPAVTTNSYPVWDGVVTAAQLAPPH